MRIEIDQSGKIENTSKNTIIAFSNGEFKSIFISAKDKREVQKVFRSAGKQKVFIYRIFAILIFLLIKDRLKRIHCIVIDEEYPGKSVLIKSFLLLEIRKINPRFPKENISFQKIGKKSRTHFLAYGAAIGRKQADLRVGSKEILRYMIK